MRRVVCTDKQHSYSDEERDRRLIIFVEPLTALLGYCVGGSSIFTVFNK